jgi:DNA transformation protein and related proteins
MMNFMRDHDNLTAYLLELLAPLGPISARRMFGGVGLFHGGMMFGLIARDELFLKVARRAVEAAVVAARGKKASRKRAAAPQA